MIVNILYAGGSIGQKTATATMRRKVAAWQITRKKWRVYLDFILHKHVKFNILNDEGICRT